MSPTKRRTHHHHNHQVHPPKSPPSHPSPPREKAFSPSFGKLVYVRPMDPPFLPPPPPLDVKESLSNAVPRSNQAQTYIISSASSGTTTTSTTLQREEDDTILLASMIPLTKESSPLEWQLQDENGLVAKITNHTKKDGSIRYKVIATKPLYDQQPKLQKSGSGYYAWATIQMEEKRSGFLGGISAAGGGGGGALAASAGTKVFSMKVGGGHDKGGMDLTVTIPPKKMKPTSHHGLAWNLPFGRKRSSSDKPCHGDNNKKDQDSSSSPPVIEDGASMILYDGKNVCGTITISPPSSSSSSPSSAGAPIDVAASSSNVIRLQVQPNHDPILLWCFYTVIQDMLRHETSAHEHSK